MIVIYMLNLWIYGCENIFMSWLPKFLLEEDELRLGKLVNKKLGESRYWSWLISGFEPKITITQLGPLPNFNYFVLRKWFWVRQLNIDKYSVGV